MRLIVYKNNGEKKTFFNVSEICSGDKMLAITLNNGLVIYVSKKVITQIDVF